MSDKRKDSKVGELILGLIFTVVTFVIVNLIARWGEKGFLGPLHEAAFARSLDDVDGWNVFAHYVPFVGCVSINLYVFARMPRWLQLFALAVILPLVLLGYWFLTNDYNY